MPYGLGKGFTSVVFVGDLYRDLVPFKSFEKGTHWCRKYFEDLEGGQVIQLLEYGQFRDDPVTVKTNDGLVEPGAHIDRGYPTRVVLDLNVHQVIFENKINNDNGQFI